LAKKQVPRANTALGMTSCSFAGKDFGEPIREVTVKASAGEPVGEGEPGAGAAKGEARRMRHDEQ